MVYLDNDSTYSQRIYIPRNEYLDGATGHTITLQSKDYTINQNGVTKIHPDAGYDGISGGTIGVFVSAATGVTFEHLNVEENGVYIPTGDTAYSGVTVNVEEGGYDEGYHDGFEAGYSSGYTEGYSSGSTDGFASGYTSGMTDGYASGSTEGFASGYTSGMTDGYSSGYTEGFEAGYASGHTDGYSEGYTDGEAAQKAKLTAITATTNGTYAREDGYSSVVVNVSGSTPAVLTSVTATTNNTTLTPPQGVDGFNEVTVDIDVTPVYNSGYTSGYTDGYATGSTEGYASGVTDGQEAQKALLTSATFTQNGIYTRENGWNSVDVDLPLGNTTITIENNTTTELEPPAGFEGFKKVTIITNVTGSTPAVLTGLTATTNNTTYLPPQGADGFNRVDVNIDTAPYYNSGYTEGYASGYTSGETDGYASGYASGTTDGYASGSTEGFASGYTSGVTDGLASGYTSGYTEGYSSGSTDGFSSGVTYQKSQMVSTTIRANGNYTREDGWNSIIVDVPFTQILTQAQYDALSYKDPRIIYLING